MKRTRWTTCAVALLLLLAACGGDGDGPGDTTGDGPADTGDASEGLSIPTVEIAISGEQLSNVMAWVVAQEQTLPEVGFESADVFFAEDDSIAPLLSGAVWIAQEEAGNIFPAIEAGVADLVVVGVDKDRDLWMMASAPHIETPEDLVGATFSAGAPGDTWVAVAEIVMGELGIDPADVNWVSVGGGTDGRIQSLLAGQIEGTMAQLRHIPPVEEAGGHFLYHELVPSTQELWVVERDTWENNRDAVCAFIEGRVLAKQWILEGAEERLRFDEISQLLLDDGYDPAGLEETWLAFENQWNWSVDGGATPEAFDLQTEILQREGGELSADFEWRDHVDFSCVHEVQEKLGLPLRPDPDSM